MATNKLYTLYAAQAGSTFIDQVERSSYSSGIDDIILRANGSTMPQFAAIAHQSPRMELTTTNLVAALAAGSSGWTASGGNTAKFWFRRYTNLGTLDAGATALRLTMAQGFILPTRLSADQRRATLDLSVIPIHNGTDLPFVAADNQALTGAPAISHVHVAGHILLGSTVIEGVQSINVDFGIKTLLGASDGDAYDTFGSIEQRQPMITVQTTDLSAMATVGTQALGGTFTLYLRAVAANGVRVADATASHIKLTGTIARTSVDGMEAAMGSAGTATLKIVPVWDGTNDILAINTASEIA